MDIFTLLLTLLSAIAVDCAAAFAFRNVARMKGHDESGYFWWCFLFPPVGYLLVISLPDRNPPRVLADAPSKPTTSLYRKPSSAPVGHDSPLPKAHPRTHSWRCSCGQMISSRPCPHCGQE